MGIFYDIFYYLFLILGAPYIIYRMVTSGKYRSGIGEKLGFLQPRQTAAPGIWVHGVSVGEVLSARGLVQRLKKRFPSWEIVISTTTDTGQEVAHRNYPHQRVIYYPLDLSWAVRRALRRINPCLVILVELDFWPNFVRTSKARGASIAVVNGRISEESFRSYRRLWPFLKHAFSSVDLFAVQGEAYARRFTDLGIPKEKIVVTGTMKYDTVVTEINEALHKKIMEVLRLSDEHMVLVAGSTHEGEEKEILSIYSRLLKEFPKLRLIIVPRHPERFEEASRIISESGFECLRKTQLEKRQSAGALTGEQVILVDTIGELIDIYGLADVAFVGGSLTPKGGHNMLEPAALAKPVLFGPYVFNFQDVASSLLEAQAAIQVEGPAQLENSLKELLRKPEKEKQMGQAGRKLVLQMQGATERTLDLLIPLVEKASSDNPSAAARKR
jgi:3-deoxy-D-manno-octulosonic-acid transferase